jgi:MFS family permease
MQQFLDYFNHPNSFLQGGITASIQAGAFAGSLLTGAFLADKFGRKKTILFGSALFTVGCAIAAASNGVAALVAGRVINGLGNGCLAMMVKAFIPPIIKPFLSVYLGPTLPKRDCSSRVS